MRLSSVNLVEAASDEKRAESPRPPAEESVCALGRIPTCDTRFRKPALYLGF